MSYQIIGGNQIALVQNAFVNIQWVRKVRAEFTYQEDFFPNFVAKSTTSKYFYNDHVNEL